LPFVFFFAVLQIFCSDGTTALIYAFNRKHTSVVAFLRSLGSDFASEEMIVCSGDEDGR